MLQPKLPDKPVRKYWPTIVALTAGLVLVVAVSYISVSKHQAAQTKTAIAHEDVVAFEFPAEGPIKTFHMDHDEEAIITMYWGQHTWAHIERFTSEVWSGEPTVLELEEPQPGLYPLTLDTGEIRGYVQVD